jgi:hypothetical protein
VFEIYVIHSYLYVRLFDNLLIDFLISYIVIIAVALSLHRISANIQRRLH